MGRGLRAAGRVGIVHSSVQNQGAGPVSDCEPHGLKRRPTSKAGAFHVEQQQRSETCFTWNTADSSHTQTVLVRSDPRDGKETLGWQARRPVEL